MSTMAPELKTVDSVLTGLQRAPERTAQILSYQAAQMGLEGYKISLDKDGGIRVSYISREDGRSGSFHGKYFPNDLGRNEFNVDHQRYTGEAATRHLVSAITLDRPARLAMYQ